MIRVGITGGIGSGKSIICQIFEKLEIPVYYADLRAKYLMNTDLSIRERLISRFGNKVYQNGMLNRSLLASLIFKNKEALTFVNQLVHPVVANDSEQWFREHGQEPYRIKEAALFFESRTNREVDFMITVTAPENLRLSRVCNRDGIPEVQVRNRMENQLPDEEKIKKSDFVIVNDDKSSVLEQVLQIHHILISKSKNGKIC